MAQSLSSQAESKPSWNGDEVRVKVEVVVTWKREKGYGKVCGGHGEEEEDGSISSSTFCVTHKKNPNSEEKKTTTSRAS